MKTLGPKEFRAFFESVHGRPPFPWQARLAEIVVKTGRWPSLIDLPTGTGKTATIDVAVFHLACEAAKKEARRAPLRILFVIDRRIVVDAAFERAKRIAEALNDSKSGVLLEVAAQLCKLSGEGNRPLDVVCLRGGVPQERDWARSPAQPLVAVSTVDQVGSRLLFRGYGVSQRMWPVHAGLIGADSLWLLDEVHLSKPFEETLDAIAHGHGQSGPGILSERPRLAPFAVVRLSATPGTEKPADWFPGEDFDIRKNAPSNFLNRLDAHKRARLVPAEGDRAAAFAQHALRFAGLADLQEVTTLRKGRQRSKKTENQAARPVARVAVVVNQVDLARRTFEKIKRDVGGRADVLLLTGRIRPLDRERLTLEPLLAGDTRAVPSKPIILVATQTIEAGADLDVDALVTEIAPLDSLRQRFGRLDRFGTRRESEAVILYPAGRPSKTDRDNPWFAIARIYGESALETKEWLETLEVDIDFGIEAFKKNLLKIDKELFTRLLATGVRAPTLLPAYVQLWAMTWPQPGATPEPSLFLHGPGKSTDVHVVWRADVDPSDEKNSQISLKLCPPSALEALPVPVWAIRKWLRQERGDAAIADVPESSPEREREISGGGKPVLRRHNEKWITVYPGLIKPGDMIALPAAYGGCDQWGWNPQSDTEVPDLGAEAHYIQRRKAALRLTKRTLANALAKEPLDNRTTTTEEVWKRIVDLVSDMEDDVDGEEVSALLASEKDFPSTWQKLLSGIARGRPAIEFYDDAERKQGFILFSNKQLERGLLDKLDEIEAETGTGVEAITDRENSSSIDTEVPLLEHLAHVERWARDFATRAGLDERMTNLVALAARLHDLGKSDPRFQADLRGIGGLAARDPELAVLLLPTDGLIAKSSKPERGRTKGFRGVRAAPENFRHEALSVALAEKHASLAVLPEEDRDLVMWLVGTHHGYGRPFFPPCFDPAADVEAKVEIDGQMLRATAGEVPLRLDQGWLERADRLNRRFGPWEIARLEAIVRLADHAASAEEQHQGRKSIQTGKPVEAVQ